MHSRTMIPAATTTAELIGSLRISVPRVCAQWEAHLAACEERIALAELGERCTVRPGRRTR